MDDLSHGDSSLAVQHRMGSRPFIPSDLILFEGILVLYNPKVRDELSMKIFVDVDSDSRLSATVVRDTSGSKGRRARELDVVLNQWMNYVKPAFEDFVLPVRYLEFNVSFSNFIQPH
jgi:uridine kinase